METSDRVRPTCLFLIVYTLFAVSSGWARAEVDGGAELSDAGKDIAIDYLSEFAERRRLTRIFPNEQSPLYGVQIALVNTSIGNLTFLNRDIVRTDVLPIVFGRIYDSRIVESPDFGPGWKLAPLEYIEVGDSFLTYTDASNSRYELHFDGKTIKSQIPHLSAIRGGRLHSRSIVLYHMDFKKEFVRTDRNHYSIKRISDRAGNSVNFDYEEGALARIHSTNGRQIRILRNDAGRVIAATDDSNRSVGFEYDDSGRLVSFRDVGGATWKYAYESNNYLVQIEDPRGQTELEAAFSSNSLKRISWLHNKFGFEYFGKTTRVTNEYQETASFWQHPSGLTQTIRDFAGNTTSLQLNDSLRATAIRFNGADIGVIEYDSSGRQRTVSYISADSVKKFKLNYRSNRVESIRSEDGEVASYKYGRSGLPLVVSDSRGKRTYEYYSDGRLRKANIGGERLDFEQSDVGLLEVFSRNGAPVFSVLWDEYDQVARIDALGEGGQTYPLQYSYTASGLRSSAQYGRDAYIDFDYDALGNLTELSGTTQSGRSFNDRYIIGPANQLQGIESDTDPSLSVEYDRAGRVARISQDDRIAKVTYDRNGRLTTLTLDGDDLLQFDYGPMDPDVITASDRKSMRTYIHHPAASAVFGNVDGIRYSRTRGSIHGLIRFDGDLTQFVLAPIESMAPDATTLASLHRRQLPFGTVEFNVAPLSFDKPSSNFFLPPEFHSLNCVVCVKWISDATLTIPANVAVGDAVGVSFTGNGQCQLDDQMDPFPTFPPNFQPFLHSLSFGDGNTASLQSIAWPGISTSHTYNLSGVFVASNTVYCGCASLFSIAVASQQVTAVAFVQFPSGPGHYSYEPAANQWGTQDTIDSIVAFTTAWNSTYPNYPKIGVGDISLKQGGPMPGHTSGHRIGKNVDIRPVRNDNVQAGTTWQDSTYSRQRTQELVDIINQDSNVSKIYFNDPNIQGVQPLAGHDNHLHVEYKN